MKAKELIKLLKTNPEAEVYLASDEEGNNYSSIIDNGDVTEKMFVLYPYKEANSIVMAEQSKVLETVMSK